MNEITKIKVILLGALFFVSLIVAMCIMFGSTVIKTVNYNSSNRDSSSYKREAALYVTENTTQMNRSTSSKDNSKSTGNNTSCELADIPPDSLSKCCGVIVDPPNSRQHKRSIGGLPALPEQYPWLVIVEPAGSSGFLISGRYVITSAQSVLTENRTLRETMNIRLGNSDIYLEKPTCIRTPEMRLNCDDEPNIAVEATVIHKDFFTNNVFIHNIALIRLKKLAPFTNYIRPICLPTSDITVSPPRNLKLDFVGWGATAQLYFGKDGPFGEYFYLNTIARKHLELPYISIEECQKKFDWVNWNNHICAGGMKGKGPCKKDSGGPLMNNKDGIMEVVGIESYGIRRPCGKEGYPSIFTKVFEYKTWIYDQIGLWHDQKFWSNEEVVARIAKPKL